MRLPLDIDALKEALAEAESDGHAPFRFQIICPKCGQPVWTAEDRIGDQTNCQDCDAVMAVEAPKGSEPPGTDLAITAAGTAKHPSPYTTLAGQKMSPASSLEELFRAFPSVKNESEALRRLRDPSRRFAHDLLCYPHWHNNNGGPENGIG